MTNRCILIFPDFPNIATIESIRGKYDPLAELVRPHITLVFPFESDIATEALAGHVRRALAGFSPFEVSLMGVTEQKGFDSYLLLRVHEGKNTIKEMHRRLYTGLLAPYKPHWSRSFEPHMTVGKLADANAFERAVEETKGMSERFVTCVGEIASELIGADGSSAIEFTVKLPAL